MAASCSAGKGYEIFYLLFSRKGAKAQRKMFFLGCCIADES